MEMNYDINVCCHSLSHRHYNEDLTIRRSSAVSSRSYTLNCFLAQRS